MLFPLMTLIAQADVAGEAADPAPFAALGYLGWVLLAAIVLAFLAVGLRDLARVSWTRISAISSVSFDESIRRRVLWITPLAIVGAVAVSQLQNPVDPQDAIRQTTKICIFATGLVVTLVAIILASTNLQKEIETRVIYTIVTKPTTRLEIVLGKIWGFAKVSAAILLIMGVFTYAYLHVRAWRLSAGIAAALEGAPADAVHRPTLEHYQRAGLLNAKAMSEPQWMQMLARPPVEGEPRWMAGGQGQQFTMRFRLGDAELSAVEEALKRGGRVSVVAEMPVTVRLPTESEMETIRQTRIPTLDEAPEGGAPAGPLPLPAPQADPATAPATAPTTGPAALPLSPAVPVLALAFRNRAGEPLVTPQDINNARDFRLPVGAPRPAEAPLSPAALERLFDEREFTLTVEGGSPGVEYAVGERPITLAVVERDGTIGQRFEPLPQPGGPIVYSSTGRYGQQLIGGAEGIGGVAVFRFAGARIGSAEGDRLTFEVRTGVERAGEGLEDREVIPEVQLRVRDRATGALSEPATFRPETNRTSYVSLPRAAFPADGNFDVLLRVLTPEQWLGVQPRSVALGTGDRSFAFNLVKSLAILWLMSVLVVSIAVCCSTFVSWPIAVVLTLVILLGRWGVEQVGGAGPGLGAVVTGQTDDAVKARIVRSTVDTLGKALAVTSAFLPDVSRFQATTDIERGVSVPLSRFAGAGAVLLGYGVPMVILAYLILKRKEVAP